MKAILFGFDTYDPEGGADQIVAVLDVDDNLEDDLRLAAAAGLITEAGGKHDHYELVEISDDNSWRLRARWHREGYGDDVVYSREV